MIPFSEAYDQIPSNGWLLQDEAELLYSSAASIDGPMLEVGAFYGRSTCLLGRLGRPMYAVDPFEGFLEPGTGNAIEAALKENLLSRGLTNVVVVRQRIEEWVSPLSEIPFIYLDGDHTFQGTTNQVTKALSLKARVIAVHDVSEAGDGDIIRKVCLDHLGPWAERQNRMAVWRLS